MARRRGLDLGGGAQRLSREKRLVGRGAGSAGREILLTPARWLHILIRHGELKPHRDAVLAAVSDPDLIRLGNEPNERWFFAANTGPSRWLQVVVHYDEGSGRITTAFGRRWLP